VSGIYVPKYGFKIFHTLDYNLAKRLDAYRGAGLIFVIHHFRHPRRQKYVVLQTSSASSDFASSPVILQDIACYIAKGGLSPWEEDSANTADSNELLLPCDRRCAVMIDYHMAPCRRFSPRIIVNGGLGEEQHLPRYLLRGRAGSSFSMPSVVGNNRPLN
jgi:hypothetical protein